MATRESLPVFEVGEAVILPANEEEGWAEQEGVVSEVEKKDMYIVEVTPEDDEDDGIREVHASGIQKKKT